MASNTSPDPSSSESFQYDVYASYRGKDVRKRIVDVLYWALEGTGVNYFSEYEEVETQGKMPTLDRIKVVLKQSRSAIVIFSKNYASLPWCLNELVEIMARQLPVYIVFYDVSPTDVGKQQGDFGKEFNSVAAMKEYEDKKAGWKKALKDAANLPDKYDLTDTDGFESSCITEIVQWCLSRSQNKFNKFMIDSAAKVGGKLAVWREKIIGTGSNGTFVCEGSYIDRPVAVKCLKVKAKDSNSLAFNEFEILRACDHPNIVGLHGIENDKDYVYLSLEKCDGNLKDLIEKNCTGQLLERVNDIVKDPAVLWRKNGYPSPLLLKLMRDVVKGLVYLHNSAIVHGDLKPENVLFKPKQKSLCAKICDMGTSKRLSENESEQGTAQIATGRAGDVFSLGRVLFYCITGGKLSFDDIDLSNVQLSSVESIPEATDLFSLFSGSDAKKWPTASEVLQHPLLWKTKKRLSFLRKTSDILNNKKTTPDVRVEVDKTRSAVFGDDKEWTSNMDDKLIENLKKSPGSNYNYESVVHLLRAIRNKYHHYEELSEEP